MTSHRQGYPFQGCVPTEPWSVSPCADIELYSRLDKQMTFRAYAWKNPGGSGAKPLRDTAIVSMFPASISFRCSKSFLNKKEDKLNTVATQRSGTRTRTRIARNEYEQEQEYESEQWYDHPPSHLSRTAAYFAICWARAVMVCIGIVCGPWNGMKV